MPPPAADSATERIDATQNEARSLFGNAGAVDFDRMRPAAIMKPAFLITAIACARLA